MAFSRSPFPSVRRAWLPALLLACLGVAPCLAGGDSGARDADARQRRSSLRDTVQQQTQAPSNAAPAQRQLNSQERAELRRQLRERRNAAPG